MTERASRPRRSYAKPVYAVTGATFAVAAVGLGAQMASGHDPSLGAGKLAAVAPVTQGPVVLRRHVLVRRIVKTTVITRVLPPKAPTSAAGGGGSVAVSAPSGASSSVPTRVAAPAPVQAAPAPVPVAAPAPAPAPVTRSS